MSSAPGGNHAGFSNYDTQKGDFAADITAAEQQQCTAQAVANRLSHDLLTEDVT